jgi:hypothetical protein
MVLLEWDMEMGRSVSVLLGKTKINDIDVIATRAHTYQKIGGFDVTVNEVGRVDTLYA